MSSPEKYGDYFAWGEKDPDTSYDWASYKWCNGGESKLTKYCPKDKTNYWDGFDTPDGFTILINHNYVDDAARAKLKDKWRIPTEEEWSALLKLDWIATTLNGIYGAKISASNGNSIFLPFSGFMDNSDLYFNGMKGYYWSSSISTVEPSYAHYYSYDSQKYESGVLFRCWGLSIRPVTE